MNAEFHRIQSTAMDDSKNFVAKNQVNAGKLCEHAATFPKRLFENVFLNRASPSA